MLLPDGSHTKKAPFGSRQQGGNTQPFAYVYYGPNHMNAGKYQDPITAVLRCYRNRRGPYDFTYEIIRYVYVLKALIVNRPAPIAL